jgi:hypothetical protein
MIGISQVVTVVTIKRYFCFPAYGLRASVPITHYSHYVCSVGLPSIFPRQLQIQPGSLSLARPQTICYFESRVRFLIQTTSSLHLTLSTSTFTSVKAY